MVSAIDLQTTYAWVQPNLVFYSGNQPRIGTKSPLINTNLKPNTHR